jgi:autotransporter-associated beta strand protein
LTVNIGGSGATLTWGSTANFVGDGQSLIFGSASGNSDVFWVNPIDFSNSTRTVQVNGSRSATMEGVLSGSGGLTKTGGGKLILSANNTYTGDTLVNQGMLVVNGEVLSSAFTVNSRAFLAGTGTVTGEVDGGGTIAPGNNPGVLTLGAVDPSAGLSFNFEFTTLNQSDYTVSNDVLRLTSGTPFAADLSLTNTVNLTFNVQSGLVAGQTNWFTGGFYVDAGDFEASITGAVYNVAVPYYTSSGWTLVKRTIADGSFAPGGYVTQFGLYAEQLTVIPEPAVVLLWVAGGVTIFAARRRARRLQPRV